MQEVKSEAEKHRLIGGALCLDFANTLNGHGQPQSHEYLISYDDLVVWSRRASLLTQAEARQLIQTAGRRSSEAAAIFKRAIGLRETIFRVFVAVAAGGSPQPADIRVLDEARLEALNHTKIDRSLTAFVVDWTDKAALDRILWPIALSAAELLTSNSLNRVRECGGDSCDWLFVDTSRNHLRRWCSMDECGNRAKSQRFLARRRKRRTH
jgi:predicted RNA-binding Zn ribbon-like protein